MLYTIIIAGALHGLTLPSGLCLTASAGTYTVQADPIAGLPADVVIDRLSPIGDPLGELLAGLEVSKRSAEVIKAPIGGYLTVHDPGRAAPGVSCNGGLMD